MQRSLDLRTGVPVWDAYRASRIPTRRLKRDITCDALVVGLGISGAMIAETLSAQGLAIIGVDRRGVMLGSTAATTALVQFEIDQPLSELRRTIGQADATRAWRRSLLAVTNLQGRIRELDIRCDMATVPSLYLAGDTLGRVELREEAEARASIGIRATHLTPTVLKETFGIAREGAILSHGNLAVDPRKLTAGLLKKALERKARFYAPVEVIALAAESGGVEVETKGGPVILARHVVLATGYELLDMVPSDTHSIISTYAIATTPQKRKLWPGLALIWEASDPYLYLRATADGRVICGGEDEDFANEESRDRLLADKARALSAKLGALFPQLDARAEFAWTGSFGTTTTGLPYIGGLPRYPHVFAAQGYGGNGITYSQIASELVATAISGGDDADASLFAYGSGGVMRKLADRAGALLP